MSKKHKKAKSDAQQMKVEAANLTKAHASAALLAVDACLRDVDQLCINRQYTKALDRICRGLQQPEADNVGVISKYEGRLVTAIGELCGEAGLTGELVPL